jgi:hypothetical protein
MVNRMEEVQICALQTFSPYKKDFTDDIFYYFSSQYATNTKYTLNTNYIYILVHAMIDSTYQYYPNINCIYTPNAFPLVITDLDISIGNINSELINYTEFYDINIYLQNGYTEDQLNSVSYYTYIDTIIFNNNLPGINTQTTSTYLRFGLSLSTGNVNGNNYNINGNQIIPCITSNIILSSGINKVLNTYQNVSTLNSFDGKFGIVNANGIDPSTSLSGTYNNNTYTAGIVADYNYYESRSSIGRALLFRWIYDIKSGTYVTYEFDSDNEKKRTLLHILGWPIANETVQLFSIDQNNGFRFVHTNYQGQLVTKSTLATYEIYSNNNYPTVSLKLQYYSNNYFFINNNYVFLKIYLGTNDITNVESEYINTVSSKQLQYNQNYINSSIFNVNIGQDFTCLPNNQYLYVFKKDQSYIFAKLLLSDIPGNTDIRTSNIINNNSFYIFYDNVKDNVDSITVEVFDADMKLLFVDNNFSFTVNIHEVKDILKETLINTKNNNVTTTGYFI